MAIKPIVVLLVGLAFVSVHLAEAQQTKKVPRIGVISPAFPSAAAPFIEAFREGLHDLGFWRFTAPTTSKTHLELPKKIIQGPSTSYRLHSSVRGGKIVELVSRTQLPAMYFNREFVDVGGLMSYGANTGPPAWTRF